MVSSLSCELEQLKSLGKSIAPSLSLSNPSEHCGGIGVVVDVGVAVIVGITVDVGVAVIVGMTVDVDVAVAVAVDVGVDVAATTAGQAGN